MKNNTYIFIAVLCAIAFLHCAVVHGAAQPAKKKSIKTRPSMQLSVQGNYGALMNETGRLTIFNTTTMEIIRKIKDVSLMNFDVVNEERFFCIGLLQEKEKFFVGEVNKKLDEKDILFGTSEKISMFQVVKFEDSARKLFALQTNGELDRLTWPSEKNKWKRQNMTREQIDYRHVKYMALIPYLEQKLLVMVEKDSLYILQEPYFNYDETSEKYTDNSLFFRYLGDLGPKYSIKEAEFIAGGYNNQYFISVARINSGDNNYVMRLIDLAADKEKSEKDVIVMKIPQDVIAVGFTSQGHRVVVTKTEIDVYNEANKNIFTKAFEQGPVMLAVVDAHHNNVLFVVEANKELKKINIDEEITKDIKKKEDQAEAAEQAKKLKEKQEEEARLIKELKNLLTDIPERFFMNDIQQAADIAKKQDQRSLLYIQAFQVAGSGYKDAKGNEISYMQNLINTNQNKLTESIAQLQTALQNVFDVAEPPKTSVSEVPPAIPAT